MAVSPTMINTKHGPLKLDDKVRVEKAIALGGFFEKGILHGAEVMDTARGLYTPCIRRCGVAAGCTPTHIETFIQRLKAFKTRRDF